MTSRTLSFGMIHQTLKQEWRRIFTFGVIGFSSLLGTLGLYALVSRILWPNGPHTVQYTLVNIFITWLNYEANRHFTFQKTPRDMGSVGRFATVAVIATGLNSVLFWLGHEVMYIRDFYVIIANAFIVASFTFTAHRLFTFHERPWRWLGK